MKKITQFMEVVRDWCDKQPIKILLAIHLAISSLGTIGAFFGIRNIFIVRYENDWMQQSIDSYKYFNWLKPYFFPTHKYVIAGYGVVVVLLGVLMLIMLIINSNHELAKRLSRNFYPEVYLADIACVILCLTMVVNRSLSNAFILGVIGLWLACMFVPLLELVGTGKYARLFGRLLNVRWLLLLSLVQFALALQPFLMGKVVFFNDYFGEIPTYTWVRKEPEGKRHLVDTIQFINENKLWGHERYDPRQNPGEDPACDSNFRIPTKDIDKTINLSGFESGNFYYHHPSGNLCFVGKLSEEDYNTLIALFPGEAREIKKLQINNNLMIKRWHDELPTYEVFDFINQNNFEISQSLDLLEATIHHHFQLLNPIKELHQGRSLHEIIAPYGLNFIPIYLSMKAFGEVDYQTFLKVVFFSYCLYLLVFCYVLWVILRDLRYVTIVMLTKVGCIQALGYVTLFAGVGYSPVRYFHDILLILLVFQYLKTNRQGWLWGALVTAFGGLLLDKLFGSFGVIALMAMIIVRCLNGSRRNAEIYVLVTGIIAFPIIFLQLGQVTAPNPYVNGFLDGIWGFPISSTRLVLLLFTLLFSHLIVFSLFWREKNKTIYFPLFLLFYTEMVAFYWLIIPNYGHFFQLLPWFILFVAVTFQFYVKEYVSKVLEGKIIVLALAISSIFGAYASLKMMLGSMRVNKNTESHKIFVWPFEQAKINSTMDPKIFADAANLIGRWSPEKGVFVISQYDTLLLYLANRYSLAPHFDLVSYLSGPLTERKTIESLREQRPTLLFVDSCIDCSLQTLMSSRSNILQVNPDQYNRISEKIDRLNQLKKIFNNVKSEYELVERGQLISVYHLKGEP